MALSVKPFTMIGATTRSGLLSSPLRDRFGQHYHLDFYAHDDLAQIIKRSAHLLAMRIDDEAALELASRSRGTPRIANRLLRRVRDFAQVNEASLVTREVALGALELLEIDACGFDRMDRAILLTIINKFGGGPVGVDTRGRGRRGIRDDWRCLRALPPAGGIHHPHRAWPCRHAARVCASEPFAHRYIAMDLRSFRHFYHLVCLREIERIQDCPLSEIDDGASAG
jgi:hypothetical protein